MSYRKRVSSRSRRGVLLLVVLSLLVMFLLAGMTFIVVASSFKKSTAILSRHDQVSDPVENIADAAMYQILRGTTNSESVFSGPVSLLEDTYGRDGFVGRIVETIPTTERATAGQFHEFIFEIQRHMSADGPVRRDPITKQAVLSSDGNSIPILMPGANYSGSVITFRSGTSSRIVRFKTGVDLGETDLVFRVTRGTLTVLQKDGISPQVGDWFVVNGRPYNGTGHGFSDAGELALGIRTDVGVPVELDLPFSLTPNMKGLGKTIRELQGTVRYPIFPPPSDDWNIDEVINRKDVTPVMVTDTTLNPARTEVDFEHSFVVSSPAGVARADESWDAPDLQNPHLASIPDINPIRPRAPFDNRPIIASFHRPELVQFWMKRLYQMEPFASSFTPQEFLHVFEHPYGDDPHSNEGPDGLQGTGDEPIVQDDPNISRAARDLLVAVRRSIIMRPLPEDNPEFNGSNPTFHSMLSGWANVSDLLDSWGIYSPVHDFTYVDGPGSQPYFNREVPFSLSFDIDNDGDGFKDSLWLDAGLPSMRAKDGRLYKPLIAPLCVDLDSKINVNTASRLAILSAPIDLSGNASDWDSVRTQLDNVVPDSDNLLQTGELVFGQGFGPADIGFPSWLVTEAEAWIQNLDAGVTVPIAFQSNPSPDNPRVEERWLAERYSSMNMMPGGIARESLLTKFAPGSANVPDFGWTDQYDTAYLNFQENYHRSKVHGNMFRTPGDVHGRIAKALDHAGQPVYANRDRANEFVLSPYRFNLLTENHYDTRFDEQDLEGLLRSWDPDVPRSRVVAALDIPANVNSEERRFQSNVLARRLRTALTTRSFEVPSLPTINPSDYDFKVGWAEDGGNTIVDEFFRRKIVVDSESANGLDQVNALKVPDANNNPDTDLELRQIRSIQDLFIARLVSEEVGHGGNTPPPRPVARTDFEQLRDDLSLMMPYEIARGQRFDLNRPFGNGKTDDSGSIPDEESDFLDVTLGDSSFRIYGEASDPSFVDASGVLAVENLLNGDPRLVRAAWGSDAEREKVLPLVSPMRQTFARHLYCLMMFLLPPDVEYDVDGNGGTSVEEKRMLARDIAQYAINVVDFRDIDSIMTPFEFDMNPYDGWDVSYNMRDDHPEEGIVWGTEQPQLLMTEAIAFHDRRTEDLPDYETTADDPADNFDQRLKPESGFFVELYNASSRTVLLPHISDDGESSTWRLVVAIPPDAKDRDPDDKYAPDTNEFEWDSVDRLIYFGEPLLAGAMHRSKPYFFHRDALPLAPLLPGRYAVVGGGKEEEEGNGIFETYVGRLNSASKDDWKLDETRRIVLEPTNKVEAWQVFTHENTPLHFLNAVDYHPPVAVIMDGWGEPVSARSGTRSLSITDPSDGGYEQWVAVHELGHTFSETAEGDAGAFTPVIDDPIDYQRSLVAKEYNGITVNPWAPLLNKGTTPNFRTIYLQRLADPSRPWDLATNPYRTVDEISTDLTAFNGLLSPFDVDDEYKGKAGTTIAPANVAPVSFKTLQRGDDESKVLNAIRTRSLWPVEPKHVANATAASSRESSGGHNFPFELQHTLGYLNQGYWRDGETRHAKNKAGGPENYIGSPDAESGSINMSQTFPWISWNDRPYTTATEILQVPFRRSSQISKQFTYKGMPASEDEYETEIASVKAYGRSRPFGHLWDFFGSSRKVNEHATHAYRLLDFVEVRSPFAGVERDLPGDFKTRKEAFAPTAGYRFPLNYVSRFRNPGQVNINTVSSKPVWDAIVTNAAGSRTYSDMQVSLRGSEQFPPANPIRRKFTGFLPALNYPTLFANPFRAAANATHMPHLPGVASATDMMKRDRSVDATLLRAAIDESGAPGNDPLLKFESSKPFDNSSRNSEFRYQHLERLDSLTTTQSNVYALWLTVGYFEVSPETGQLGREMGLETGDIKRHRAFYVIDRSIPVAFEPGKNHNVDKAVVLRRMIE